MKLHCVAIVTALLTAAVNGLPASADEADFETLEHKGTDDAVLKYRLLKPEVEAGSDKLHPLLVFLHGAGERGSDNKAQLQWGAEMMRSAAKTHGAFVLVPQCPKGQKWAEVDWSKQTHKMPEKASGPFGLTMQVIAKMQKELPIDPKRLYIMGLSMGGYGTWDAVQRYPDTFAAAVPICGGGDETAADRIKTPIWAFHGGADGVVPVERSRKMIEAIKKAGGKPKYTEYPGVGHNSWSEAFKDPELLKWLFSHPK
ncbi:MAG: prolyl oligopeptidase family serine peptidase [Candidatus Nealsonbacteria bacterium]|nr:prolyl oligopeptidase family serine peptidase [Candidatus Nealsonbacteria bacterium]